MLEFTSSITKVHSENVHQYGVLKAAQEGIYWLLERGTEYQKNQIRNTAFVRTCEEAGLLIQRRPSETAQSELKLKSTSSAGSNQRKSGSGQPVRTKFNVIYVSSGEEESASESDKNGNDGDPPSILMDRKPDPAKLRLKVAPSKEPYRNKNISPKSIKAPVRKTALYEPRENAIEKFYSTSASYASNQPGNDSKLMRSGSVGIEKTGKAQPFNLHQKVY